jgi:hypothetical protein
MMNIKMKHSKTGDLVLSFLLFFVFILPGNSVKAQTETLFYGIEMNGKLVGYGEMRVTPDTKEGKPVTLLNRKIFIALTALGQPFDTKISEVFHIDPRTGNYTYYDSDVTIGTMKTGATIVIDKNSAAFTPKTGGASRTLTLPPDVLLDNPLYLTFLVEDAGEGKTPQTKNYSHIDLMEGELHELSYTGKGREKLTLAEKEYDALVFEVRDLKTGVPLTIWIDPGNGRFLKAAYPNGLNIYLADGSVVGMIKRAELDDSIIARVDQAIADFKAISYMKIKASILSLGEWISPESLNGPGQKFTGTVKDNIIDGVFEIRHKRYNGEDAPPFPPDYSGDKELKKYLEPENLVESDDPVLVKKAKELAAGSEDSWEAARRLSKWVAEKVSYQIPGGSARHTFDTREGECASHSRLLTAFGRAVGIPVRLVSGCMYAPNYGGCFGQHVWNEIYMGKAGWIPVDTTVREIDYLDSGHIRLGSQTSFNPKKIEILDFKAGAIKKEAFASVLGSYKNIPWEKGKTYRFDWLYDGKSIGTETFTITRVEKKENSDDYIYTASSSVNIQGLTTSGEWTIDSNGRPMEYNVKGKAGTLEYSIDCQFSKDQVVEKVVKSGTPIERTIKLTDNVYLIDNNNLSLFAFLLAGVPREKDSAVSFKIFHPSSMQALPAQVTVRDRETIIINGKEYKSWPLDIVLAGMPVKMWVDEKGRLLRNEEKGGRLLIELVEPEAGKQ